MIENFAPDQSIGPPEDDSVQATVNALRFITNKLSFNHLDGRSDWNNRIEDLTSLEKQADSVASRAWDCAIRVNIPDRIINAAIDYCTRAIEIYSDALTFLSVNIIDDVARLDHMAARTIAQLNALNIWKMLAYHAPDSQWAAKRQHVMDAWLNCKLQRYGRSTHPKSGNSSSTSSAPINLAGQLIYQSKEVSTGLVQAIMLETAGAETLSRTELAELMRIVWLISEHIRFRTDIAESASALFFDAASGKALSNNHLNSEIKRYRGLAIDCADIEKVIVSVFGTHMLREKGSRATGLGRLIHRAMRNAWSGQKRERRTRKSGRLHALHIDHGYQALATSIHGGEKPKNLLHNAELLDVSSGGCALLVPKWIAGRNFAPGRMIAVASQDPEIQQQYGTVTWMREYPGNRLMLQFGVAFFDDVPKAVMMRCERAFPSNMHVEKLLVEVLNKDHAPENVQRRILLPSGFYQEHLVLEDTMNGEVFTLGKLISTGSDFDMAELLLVSMPGNARSSRENNTNITQPQGSSIDWSQKLRDAYAPARGEQSSH